MSTIYLLKQIIDLIYEESKYKTKLSDDALCKLAVLEKDLEEKNKEVARLYTENIKLENTVRQLEADFEIMANMYPPKSNDVIDPSGATSSQSGPVSSTIPSEPVSNSVNKKKNKPKMAGKEDNGQKVDVGQDVKCEVETKQDATMKENDETKVETEEVIDNDKPVKKDRRDYMREYQRAYRKKQREEKISMTV